MNDVNDELFWNKVTNVTLYSLFLFLLPWGVYESSCNGNSQDETCLSKSCVWEAWEDGSWALELIAFKWAQDRRVRCFLVLVLSNSHPTFISKWYFIGHWILTYSNFIVGEIRRLRLWGEKKTRLQHPIHANISLVCQN